MKKEFSENTLSVEDVVRAISKHICLVCSKNLDKDQGIGKWHIPLCTKHREEFLE